VPFGILRYVAESIGEASPSIIWFAFEVIGLAVSFAGVAVVASLLSDVYRGIYPPEPQAEHRTS
jgi:hypothetical protein